MPLTLTEVDLEGRAAHADLPVPFTRVMIATFYLTGMDIAHRLIGWLDGASLDWERATPIEPPAIAPGVATVTAKPTLKGPGDWFALVTRLRVVMEDPAQLLSGAVTDYASSELVAHGNNPSAVTVPGLDGEPYPPITH